MKWQLALSLKYLTSRHREYFISVISFISILGVAVGVASLIIVISVMSGFDNDLRDKIIGTNSHLVIESEYGMKPDSGFISKVLGIEHVRCAAYYLNGQALVRRGDNVAGVIVKGVDPSGEEAVTSIKKYLVSGSLDFGLEGIVVGSEFADRMRLSAGSEVTVVTPAYTEGKTLKVCGVFTSGMYEYDSNLVYVSIAEAQGLFGVKDLVSGLAVKTDDAFNVVGVKRSLQKELKFPYVVRTWMDMNKSLIAALKLEKTVMFIILTLIVMVACLNIASALIMTVMEKTKDIGILKAIGATNRSVMAVFTMQGGMIGLLGTCLGASSGIAICWLLKTYKFITLPKDIYYIDRLPVNVDINDVIVIVASSVLISLIATLYPAYKASRLDPVEALRYE